MEAIILAAGYATRLYPLTKDKPKPLLEIGGKPIIERIMKKLFGIDSLSGIYIITNSKFEKHFRQWLKGFSAEKPIEIINDGTTSNDDRLGALGDINYAISVKNIDSDILVIAGDNLFELNLAEAANYFRKRNSNVIVLHDVKDIGLAKQYGIVEVENELVTNFEEKPASPKSTLASTGIYFFQRRTIGLIKKYLAQGNNPDKTGNFIEWLYKREKVHSFVTDRKWYDIGSLGQLEMANKYYRED